jgi:hypothetical protein
VFVSAGENVAVQTLGDKAEQHQCQHEASKQFLPFHLSTQVKPALRLLFVLLYRAYFQHISAIYI